MEHLLEYIDAENLPTSLGGTCTCDTMGGCSLSSAGPWLDNRVYAGHGPSRYRAPEPHGETNGVSPVEHEIDAAVAGEESEEPRGEVNGLA
jgi:phosphatidylinositol/phosphatidylcholine transfer protein